MDVGEPLLLIGSINDWQIDVARRQHCFSPVDLGSSQFSQESVLKLAVPKGGVEFQVISAITTWDWRLHPCSEFHCRLKRDSPEQVPVRLSRGRSAEAAHGLNFILDVPAGKLVDVRVLLSTRFGICVWFSFSTVGLTTQEAPVQLSAPVQTESKCAESPVQLKRTAERVGGFAAFKERNQPKSMDAFKRGTPMGRRDGSPAARTKQRSTPGAFSRAVAAPDGGSAGGAGAGVGPKAFAPKPSRAPKRVVRLSLSEAKDLLEALRRVCTHQSFRRSLDQLRRRDQGAFKKRQAMAQLLGQWWKEQLRASGFTIDEHGFPQMLAAVRAHRDSAGIDIVSREVERLLGFHAGSLFGSKGQSESIEVTFRHADDGDEVHVSVAPGATVLEAKQALAAKLQRLEVLQECVVVVRTASGLLELLEDSQPLNDRRGLLVTGASISCAELAAAKAAAEEEAARRVAEDLASATAARQTVQASKQAEADEPRQQAVTKGLESGAGAEAVTKGSESGAGAEAVTQGLKSGVGAEAVTQGLKSGAGAEVAPPPPASSPSLPASSPSSPVWLVVGGAGKGGIIVREEMDLKSAELPRLCKGAKVRELERLGNRLHYQKLQGDGPETGWVNVMLNEKTLLKLLKGAQG